MSSPPSLQDKLILFGNVNIVPDHYDDWQAAFAPLGTHVHANEPNTITYYFGIPPEHAPDPSRTDYMLAFEIYASRADLYETHLKSAPMTKAFLPAALPVMTTGLDLTHFSAAAGFLDFGGVKKECSVMHDVQVRAVDEAGRREVLGALGMLCRAVEGAQRKRTGEEGEEDVLTFLGLKSLDNDVGVRIFARYKDREALDRWQRSEVVKGFWEAVKPLVADMSARTYIPNGKGWLWK